MDVAPSYILLIVCIVIAIAFFLLLREFFCWYLKINERLKIQKLTLETMLKLYEQNGGEIDWGEVSKLIK